jgi:hypothetical protein
MANLMVFKRAGAVFYAGVSPFTDFQKNALFDAIL